MCNLFDNLFVNNFDRYKNIVYLEENNFDSIACLKPFAVAFARVWLEWIHKRFRF